MVGDASSWYIRIEDTGAAGTLAILSRVTVGSHIWAKIFLIEELRKLGTTREYVSGQSHRQIHWNGNRGALSHIS